jgi:hypothetical protein
MIKRVLFNINHLDIFDLQEEYRPLLSFSGVRFVLDKLPLPGADALSLVVDGRILCCFGYIQLLPGVAEVWLLPSIYAKDHPVALVKEVNGYLESTAKVLGWHRIQTVTQCIYQHRKWMQVLGFVEEGVMKQYLDKKDYIMSARYFDGSKS